MSRQENGDKNKEVNLLEVIKGTLLVLNNFIQKHTDNFIFDLPEKLPKIQGNFQQLEQVLINIILNALQSLPTRNASIKISAFFNPDKNGSILIIVEDKGSGIDPQHMEKITEPFFTTRSEEGGTGLGLSISFDIIRSHQGTMQFKSVAGQGTIVTISLPLKREPTENEKTETRPTLSSSHTCG